MCFFYDLRRGDIILILELFLFIKFYLMILWLMDFFIIYDLFGIVIWIYIFVYFWGENI